MKKNLICIYTGQQIIGDLTKFAFYTGQFSSCSPVVLYNKKTHIGGIYHLPGKGGDKLKLKDDLIKVNVMIQKIKPTDIYLFPSGYAAKLSTEQVKDKEKFGDRDFLKQNIVFDGQITVANQGCTCILITEQKGFFMDMAGNYLSDSMYSKIYDPHPESEKYVPIKQFPSDIILFTSPNDMNYQNWLSPFGHKKISSDTLSLQCWDCKELSTVKHGIKVCPKCDSDNVLLEKA